MHAYIHTWQHTLSLLLTCQTSQIREAYERQTQACESLARDFRESCSVSPDAALKCLDVCLAAQQRNFEAYVKAMEGCVKKVNGEGEKGKGGDGGGKGEKGDRGEKGKRDDKDDGVRQRSHSGDALLLTSCSDEPRNDAADGKHATSSSSSSLSTPKDSLEHKSSAKVSTDLGDAAVMDLFHRSLEQISVAKANHKKTKRR
jgi:hypothetical protein